MKPPGWPVKLFARLGITLALFLCGCAAVIPSWVRSHLPPPEVTQGISAAQIEKHIRVLASDEYEGRAPGTRGEELTVEYLVRELMRSGARPGNPDGTYLQE